MFAGQGGSVFLAGKSEKALADTLEDLSREGARAAGCACDVSDPASMRLAVETCLEAFGGIDVLCANAGIFPQAPLESMSVEDWDKVINTNLKGTFIHHEGQHPPAPTWQPGGHRLGRALFRHAASGLYYRADLDCGRGADSA